MQHSYVEKIKFEWHAHVNINISHMHVDLIMIHSYIIILHVDVIYLACRGRKCGIRRTLMRLRWVTIPRVYEDKMVYY